MLKPFRPQALYTVTLVSVSVASTILFQACGGGGGGGGFGNAIAAVDGTPAASVDPIVGVWSSTSQIKDCTSGAVVGGFTGYAMFNAGGTASFTNSRPPASQGPGQGVWKNEGGKNYSLALVLMRFNPDGTLAGTQKARVTRTLSEDGATFTGTVSGQVIDLNGNVISTTCATDSGARVSW